MKKLIQKLLLSTFLIGIVIPSFAQSNNEAEIDLSNYKFSDKTIVYSDYSAFANQVILTVLDSITLNAITLDGNLGVVGDSTGYEFPSEGYTVQNTLIGNTTLNYLVSKENGSLSFLQLNRKDKKWSLSNNLVKDGENFLCAFPYQKKFYVFNYEKKTGIINVYNATVNGGIPFESYDLSNFKMGENDLTHFLKRKKKAIKVITSESPNELFAARKAKKAYQFEENLYISIDDSSTRTTGLINFNLKSKKHSISYFASSLSKCDKTLFNTSALSKNYLATITGCLSDASITYWDLTNRKKIKETSLNQDQLIVIKNYDNLISQKKAMSIEKLKSKVLLQKFSANNGSLFLSETNDELELIVGHTVLKKKKNKNSSINKKNGSGGGKGTGGGKARKLAQANKKKVKGLGLKKSFLNFEVSRPQYFVSTYNLKTSQFNIKATYQNSFEEIKTLKSNLGHKVVGPQIVFKRKANLWYGYFSPETGAMNLLMMK